MVPASLQQLLLTFCDAVRLHPQHALLPAQRRDIYDSLGPVSETAGRRKRGRLAILTAQHVLPLYQHAGSAYDRATHLLTLADDVLYDKVDTESAAAEAEQTWDWLTNDYGDRQEEIPDRILFALTSALEALFTAFGEERFEGVIITGVSTDDDLDPWSSDTALWAVEAIAGPARDPGSDSAKRLEFWTWWLTEAVPAAWAQT